MLQNVQTIAYARTVTVMRGVLLTCTKGYSDYEYDEAALFTSFAIHQPTPLRAYYADRVRVNRPLRCGQSEGNTASGQSQN